MCLYCSSAVDADGPPKYVTESGESFKWILLDITETGRTNREIKMTYQRALTRL